MGIEEILFPKSISKNIRNVWNKVDHGIKSVGKGIKQYGRVGINRTKEYLETANKYVTNIGNKIEHGINRIREYSETAKYVIPNALMNTLIFSNSYGRMGYYSAKAYISYKIAKQAEKGKIYYGRSNIIIPIIAGSIGGALGFFAAMWLGDFSGLNHQYQELQQEIHNLQNEVHYLQNQDNQLKNQIQYLDNQVQYLGNNNQQLQLEIQNLQTQDQQLTQQIQNLESQIQNLQTEVQTLENNNQQLQQELQNLQSEYNQLQQQLQNLQNQYQSVEQQLQNINTLTDVLFGKGNSNDISVIQINSVQIVNGYAVVNGTVYSTGENVTLGIPISYVENSNINIQEFVNDVKQNGWNAYIVIDRADLQYMNQSGWVISIQPNESVNIALMASPANGSTLDNVLNQLTKYDIVIQDGSTVYGSSTALWGWNNPSGSSVIVNFQNSNQYQLAETMINIADQIINSPGNQNPTSSGIIYTYSIFQGPLTINTNQGYPQYNVGSTYIPLIVLQSGQGNTIINNISS